MKTIFCFQLCRKVFFFNFLVKLKDYKQAVDSFEKTLDLSRAMGDEVAENAIKSALNDVNKKLAAQVFHFRIY